MIRSIRSPALIAVLCAIYLIILYANLHVATPSSYWVAIILGILLFAYIFTYKEIHNNYILTKFMSIEISKFDIDFAYKIYKIYRYKRGSQYVIESIEDGKIRKCCFDEGQTNISLMLKHVVTISNKAIELDASAYSMIHEDEF